MKQKLTHLKNFAIASIQAVLPYDKALHLLFFGALPASILFRTGLDFWQTAVAVLVLGVLKEMIDKWLGSQFDWKDVLAAMVGFLIIAL